MGHSVHAMTADVDVVPHNLPKLSENKPDFDQIGARTIVYMNHLLCGDYNEIGEQMSSCSCTALMVVVVMDRA